MESRVHHDIPTFIIRTFLDQQYFVSWQWGSLSLTRVVFESKSSCNSYCILSLLIL